MNRILLLLLSMALLRLGTAQEIPRWKIDDFNRYLDTVKSPTVINFWATYCAPCIEELPYFHRITAQYADRGVQLLLVSLDFEEMYPQCIISTAKKRGFTAPIVWLDEEKPDEFCPQVDATWSGSMPATLFYNPAGKYRMFVEAQMSPTDFEKALKQMLKNK